MVGIIYYSAAILACLLIIIDRVNAKDLARSFFLEQNWQIILGLILTIKLTMYLFYEKVSFFSYLLFLIDTLLLFGFTLGLFFYLDTYKREYMISHGHFPIIFSFVIWSNQALFIVTALFKQNKKNFSVLLGIILMTLFSLLVIKVINNIWTYSVILT